MNIINTIINYILEKISLLQSHAGKILKFGIYGCMKYKIHLDKNTEWFIINKY